MITSLLRIVLTRSFKPFIFENSNTAKLDYRDEDELGLYVHIPFCRTLCPFCPYCKVVYNESIAREYKKALLREIELVGSGTGIKKQLPAFILAAEHRRL